MFTNTIENFLPIEPFHSQPGDFAVDGVSFLESLEDQIVFDTIGGEYLILPERENFANAHAGIYRKQKGPYREVS
jgi:hypothetical protein